MPPDKHKRFQETPWSLVTRAGTDAAALEYADSDLHPERVLDRQSALTLIESALDTVRNGYAVAGKEPIFLQLHEAIEGSPSYAFYTSTAAALASPTKSRINREIRYLFEALVSP